MVAGISSATLYPMLTEEAVRTLGELGVKNIEIFVNDTSELTGAVRQDIMSFVSGFGMNVVSVHPFMSPLETLFLFSDYQRRVNTIMDIYSQYFEFAQAAGAKIIVLHGARNDARCTDEVYVERFMKLCDLAGRFGLTVAQENVHYCKSGSIDFLRMIKRECGERAKFVLDIKQAVRAGYDPLDVVDAVGENMIHLHVSDNKPGADCLPVGQGTYDIAGLIRAMRAKGFDGAMLLELYRNGYSSLKELTESVKHLENISESFS